VIADGTPDTNASAWRAPWRPGRKAWKLSLYASAACGRLAGAHAAAVGFGYGVNDRQAEPRAAGGAVACGIRAMEAVKDALALV
jgi:hypothetical protein